MSRDGAVLAEPRLRDVVSQTVTCAVDDGLASADELRVLQALHEESSDERILRRLRHGGGRDMLGFGVGDLVGVLAPLLWLSLSEGLREATGDAARFGLARLRGLLSRLFRQPRREIAVPELTPQQLRVVRDSVAASLTDAGVPAEEARLLAELAVGRIALAWADGPSGEDPSPELE